MRILFRYMCLPLLVGFLIFAGTCLIGPDNVPDMPEGISWDKLVHFGMFFLLTTVSLFDYYRLHKGAPPRGRWILWGVILPVLYGGIIELLQLYLFTSRSAEWGDWFADAAGSLAALLLARFYLRKRGKTKKKLSL
ncbi:MAG: VanZ family protein [Proteiniphilum sp.]|nr:VanZ family protein [Proteiniphilum sp.]MDD4799784.1 VanZ family protein [Proteiniphilum sp.]